MVADWGQQKHGRKKRKRGKKMGLGWQRPGRQKGSSKQKGHENNRGRVEGSRQRWECKGRCNGASEAMRGRPRGRDRASHIDEEVS